MGCGYHRVDRVCENGQRNEGRRHSPLFHAIYDRVAATLICIYSDITCGGVQRLIGRVHPRMHMHVHELWIMPAGT